MYEKQSRVFHQQAIEDVGDRLIDSLNAYSHSDCDHENRNVAEAVLDLVSAVRDNTNALERLIELLAVKLQ